MLVFAGIFFILIHSGWVGASTWFENVVQLHCQALDDRSPIKESHVDYASYLKYLIEVRKNPSLQHLRRQACALVSSGNNDGVTTIINDEMTCKNLELVAGTQKKDFHFLNKINRAATEVGYATLMHMIVHPSSNYYVSLSRQSVIRYLVDHEDVMNKLVIMMEALREDEPLVLSFWDDVDHLYAGIEGLYFKSPLDSLNGSASLLEARALYEHQMRLWNVGVLGSSMVALWGYALWGWQQSDESSDSMKNKAACAIQSSSPLSALLWNCHNENLQRWLAAAVGLGMGMHAYQQVNTIKTALLTESYIHEMLVRIARYFKHLRSIVDTCIEHPQLLHLMPELEKAIMVFEKYQGISQEVEELLDILVSRTFDEHASLFFLRGKTLRAYVLMKQIHHEFARVITDMGRLDAYVGLARLYKEHSCDENRYCFVSYRDDVTPMICANKVWNPLLDQHAAVANDLKVDECCGKNFIATGPNAGGKSTYLKAGVLAVIMAQAVGMAPATQMILVPFHLIATHMYVVDDVAQGQSRFKAEVDRAQDVYQRAQSCPGPMLVVCDELLSGTSFQEGAAAAYSFVYHLGMIPHVSCWVATHYALLTDLSKKLSSFRNIKFTIIKNSDGSLSYPYRLEYGISSQHIAFDIMKYSGMKGSIIDMAGEIVAHHDD